MPSAERVGARGLLLFEPCGVLGERRLAGRERRLIAELRADVVVDEVERAFGLEQRDVDRCSRHRQLQVLARLREKRGQCCAQLADLRDAIRHRRVGAHEVIVELEARVRDRVGVHLVELLVAEQQAAERDLQRGLLLGLRR